MQSRKSTFLVLPAAWLLCILGFRLEQMTRELVINYVLARSLGAPIDGWRMSWAALTIDARTFLLPATAQTLVAVLASLTELSVAAVLGLIEPRLRSCFGKLLCLYCSLWSLIAFLRPIQFSAFLRRNPLQGLWRGILLNPALKQTLGFIFLLLALAMLAWIFRRVVGLAAEQFVLASFWGRSWAVVCLLCIPLTAAIILMLSRFPYFRFSRAGPYLVSVFACLLVFSHVAIIKPISNNAVVPSPTRADLLKTFLLMVLCLSAIPISGWAGRWIHEKRLASYSTEHIRVLYPMSAVSETAVKAFAREAEQTFTRVAEQLNLGEAFPKVNFMFFLSAEEKLSRCGSGEFVDFDLPRNDIQVIFMPPFSRFDPSTLSRFLLEKKYGSGRNPILEAGLARLLPSKEDPRFEPQEDKLLASILEVEGGLKIADLFFPTNPDSISPYVKESLSREFARFILRRYGLTKVLALYARAFTSGSGDLEVREMLSTSYAQLQSDWAKHCLERRQELLPQFGQVAHGPRQLDPGVLIPFQKGMSLSAEGGARTGYLSEAASDSLDQLQKLHVEWISVMPFAFLSGEQGNPEIYFAHRGSWESDDSLRKIAWEAQSRGLKVFLKPHLWTSAVSTVELKISDAKAWDRWFAGYRRYILHQARLGEEIRAAMFSVGNELTHLALDPAHESDWRELIAEVRRLFSGDVIYCANWGDDFEKIRFADALDAVGLNAYYPLANRADASLDEWRIAARAIAEKVERVSNQTHRSILITELGYPSTTQAAITPWSEEGAGEVSLQAQAQAAKMFFEVFWEKPWLRGIYWWKWYSHGRGGGEGDVSYMPRGKPVAAVIADWYARPRN